MNNTNDLISSRKAKIIILSAIALMAVSSMVFAGDKHRDKGHHTKYKQFEYGKVISVTPIYREVRVSHPVRQCSFESSRHPHRGRHAIKTIDSSLAGGLIGGIIGHQIGKGKGKKLATAVGTLIGAQIGHDSNRGYYDNSSYDGYTQYEDHCETLEQVSYEEVLDGYKVKYRYRGKRYQARMPYDPGKKIKLKVSVEPVI